MMVLSDWQAFPDTRRGGVLCVGNFDGVHVGHALMLETGRDLARREGTAFVVMTFEPHPAVVLRPTSERRALGTLEQRLEILGEFSPDVVVVIPTTREFLGITAEAFLREIVQGKLGARHVVEGANFTFGRGACGTVELLRARGEEFGFGVTVVPTVTRTLSDLTVAPVSSTLVRWLVEQGRVRDAARCLGRPFAVRGTVLEGLRRGRTLGYPTANVETRQIVPAAGVYGGMAVAEGKSYPAAISVGTNPTFAGKATTIEAHLLDFAGELYGKVIEVRFERWIREMEKFAGVEPLVRQMARDVEAVRRGRDETRNGER